MCVGSQQFLPNGDHPVQHVLFHGLWLKKLCLFTLQLKLFLSFKNKICLFGQPFAPRGNSKDGTWSIIFLKLLFNFKTSLNSHPSSYQALLPKGQMRPLTIIKFLSQILKIIIIYYFQKFS